MVEKGINFTLCLGTVYDIFSMESIGNYSSIFVDRKSMPPKMFYLYLLHFELCHLYKSLLPSTKDLSIYFMQLLFLFQSPSSLTEHQLRGTMIVLQKLGVANMRVCFMNGSMIEHNGLGITCFILGCFTII